MIYPLGMALPPVAPKVILMLSRFTKIPVQFRTPPSLLSKTITFKFTNGKQSSTKPLPNTVSDTNGNFNKLHLSRPK